MKPPYGGRCLCGATAYRVTAEPIMIYACHCTDCQKRSGSAFGISMWVASTEGGRPRLVRICEVCGIRLWSEPLKLPEVAIVRAGTLDDTSWVRPVAHLWTRSAQLWFVFPPDVPRYETQPADYFELTRKS